MFVISSSVVVAWIACFYECHKSGWLGILTVLAYIILCAIAIFCCLHTLVLSDKSTSNQDKFLSFIKPFVIMFFLSLVFKKRLSFFFTLFVWTWFYRYYYAFVYLSFEIIHFKVDKIVVILCKTLIPPKSV